MKIVEGLSVIAAQILHDHDGSSWAPPRHLTARARAPRQARTVDQVSPQPQTTAVRTVRHSADERPFIVIWECTQACALACRHCRASAVPDRDPRELSTDEATELMRQVADFGKPPPIFVITGGDPFERPDLFELVRRGRALGLPVAVSPSGTARLNRESLAGLRDAGALAVSLSLDGATAETHDEFRGIPGTYERTITAWQQARELGLKVQINSTVARHNVTELPLLAATVARLGAMTWSAFLLVPMGRGTDLGQLSPAEVEDVLNFLFDLGAVVPTRTTEGHHFRRVSAQRAVLTQRGIDHRRAMRLGPLYDELTAAWKPLAPAAMTRSRRPPMNINSASGFVFVSHLGQVHPSGFLPESAGDVRAQSLAQIYRQSPLFTGLRDSTRLRGKCGACEYASLCGGSRSRAFAVTGDPYAADPLCAYEPGSFPFPTDAFASDRPASEPSGGRTLPEHGEGPTTNLASDHPSRRDPA